MAPVAVGAILFAVFLLIVAALVFQELRKPAAASPTYVLDEVVPYAFERLSERAAARVDRDGVKRILEWEVFYLQGLDVPRDHSARPAPVAGSAEAIDFIQERSGEAYDRADVAEVLAGEAQFLVGIGAVGSAVEE